MIAKSLLALAFAGLGAANCGGFILEKIPILPDGWQTLDNSVDPSHPLRLSFALRQPGVSSLKDRMGSRQYFSSNATKHMCREEARQLQAAEQADIDAVMKWLGASGCSKLTQDKAWIHVTTTVAQAEQLLNMKVGMYAFEDKKPVLRAREYTIPAYISDKISFVHPIANFMPSKKELTSPTPLRTDLDLLGKRGIPCYTATLPECLRELYNMPYTNLNATSDSTSPIRFGIAGFLEQYANYDDIHTWLNTTAKPIYDKGYNFSVEYISGGRNLQDVSLSGAEAALDMEYALALGYPTDIIFYSTGGRGPQLNDTGDLVEDEYADNEPYLQFLEHLLDKPNDELPHVLSISYADNEVSIPRPYAERVCSMIGLLTARGTTVLAGSGDGGAAGSRASNCRTNDGTERDVTMAVFPASCPWVTSIGAVTNNADPPQGATFSGGGFSQYFPRPPWQDADVEGYVKALDGHLDGFYNASMRAQPDISVVGTNFVVRYAGKMGALQGTSASTPVVASMVALINDARVKKGKPVLGWINELLYTDEVRSVLQDITGGQSKSCDFQTAGKVGGWPAAEGYDAITGLGVPNDFQKLMEVLMDA